VEQIAAGLLGTDGDYYVMQGDFIIPCTQTSAQTASVTVTLGGTTFTLKYEDFV
jgi:hypothetical protein